VPQLVLPSGKILVKEKMKKKNKKIEKMEK
jgi:hypothetical protein